MSAVVQDLVFVENLVKESAEMLTPGYAFCDNEAVVHFVQNCQTGLRTKHILTKHHFMRDLWKDRRMKIERFDTKENKADILTKNLPLQLHDCHK